MSGIRTRNISGHSTDCLGSLQTQLPYDHDHDGPSFQHPLMQSVFITNKVCLIPAHGKWVVFVYLGSRYLACGYILSKWCVIFQNYSPLTSRTSYSIFFVKKPCLVLFFIFSIMLMMYSYRTLFMVRCTWYNIMW